MTKMPSWCWLAVTFCCLAGTALSCSLEKVIEDVAMSVVSQTASLIVKNGRTEPINDDATEYKLDGRDRRSSSCRPKDCADLASQGQSRSGVYRIWPEGWGTCGMEVYCDLNKDGGGWTVIQRRGAFGNPQDYFYRRWRDYKFGFGNLTRDFWLGNDKISHLSNRDNYVLRINLKTKEGETRYAQYEEFYVEPESNKYKLWVYGFTGDGGDSLTPQNEMFFGTKDRDTDNFDKNCAVEFKGAWWYNKCHESNLNGLYLDGHHDSFANGVNWRAWKGYNYSLSDVEMKIRPKFHRGFENVEGQPLPV